MTCTVWPGLWRLDHLPVAKIDRHMVDETGVARVIGPEQQITGLKLTDRNGGSGQRLFRRRPRHADAGRGERPTDKAGAVESVRPGAPPHVRFSEPAQRRGQRSGQLPRG